MTRVRRKRKQRRHPKCLEVGGGEGSPSVCEINCEDGIFKVENRGKGGLRE